jgi:hypothetical protein
VEAKCPLLPHALHTLRVSIFLSQDKSFCFFDGLPLGRLKSGGATVQSTLNLLSTVIIRTLAEEDFLYVSKWYLLSIQSTGDPGSILSNASIKALTCSQFRPISSENLQGHWTCLVSTFSATLMYPIELEKSSTDTRPL